MDGRPRLANAWHQRVMADAVVSHAFSHGFHPEHIERLAVYWAEALGGPAAFSANYGDETAVVKMHSGHGPHHEMDERAIACFDQALLDVGLTPADALQKVLHDFRVDDGYSDGPLSRVGRGCTGGTQHSTLVLERPAGLIQSRAAIEN